MPTLIDEITRSIIAPALKKRLFADPYIPFRRYLGCYQIAFETGVVLGHAFRDRLQTFTQLFCEPGREEELIGVMQKLARQKMAEVGKADSFFDLAMFAEENRIKANWQTSGVADAQIEYLSKRLKMKTEEAYKNLCGAVSKGIGFGSAFPELTEQLWKVEHERTFTRDEWKEYRRMGVAGDNHAPPPLPLAERQEQLQSLVELFVSTSRPELLQYFRRTE